ncbi:MAG: ketol-acid reductoisomerase [Bacillati bacterium ANGP1]|uniref:Ketol-acid reductoisomerase n=1 Tax=Candidatus Segetimicrobium genomatis TaxID=2569760 RepID=A0A537JFZ8_9BACT|nr:MAG: ketol-acid reductoisomerase [Terrabacteria group bacterium ANGP1]
MAKFYFDDDADLSALEGSLVGIIGYGNQGRSQALNLRDSGITPLIGNLDDAYAEQARKDGFDPRPIPEVAGRANAVFLLIPDEVQPQVYRDMIHAHLKPGNLLCFAHGYNIQFGFIEPPAFVDVVMIAPRMLGRGVREAFVKGVGFPSLIAVQQDYSQKALARTLALSKGIGSTRMGVLMSSFEEETVIDLLGEHQPALYALRAEYEALVEAGYSPEAILLDLYASGESAVWAQAAADLGSFDRMKLASHTAQFGHLVWAQRQFDPERTRERLRTMIQDIKSGIFTREWTEEQRTGLVRLQQVWAQNRAHPMMEAEERLYRILGRRRIPAKKTVR